MLLQTQKNTKEIHCKGDTKKCRLFVVILLLPHNKINNDVQSYEK
jgi:hypothetical protein